MKRRIFSLACLTLLTLTACSVPLVGQIGQPNAGGLLPGIVTVDPNASATPTPFQPIGSDGGSPNVTPAPNVPSSPIDSPTSGPSIVLPSATPTTIPLNNRLARPSGQVNILIFGSDFRPDAGYRTDVIMLLSLYPKQGTAALVSFPRDLYVDIPGWEMQRINTAQQRGGFALTQKTFELNFGVHPDYYIMTNFNGFKSIIDTLGGIDVYAAKPLSDHCDLPKGASMKPVDGYCNVSPGWVHMDGDVALWYARARYSTSDIDRERRAQEVIQAMFTKLLSLNALTRAPQLYSDLRSTVETNLKLEDMTALLPLATKLSDLKALRRYTIGWELVTSWKTPDGAQVLLPHTEDIFEQVITKASYTP